MIGASASAKRVRVAIPGGRITVGQHGDATSLILDLGRRRKAAELPKDDMVSAGTLERAQLIGMAGPNIVLLSTTYASQTGIGGPEAQCAAGEEEILRVVALAPTLRQTDRMRVASCWNDIYGTSMTWADPSGPLVIEGVGDTPNAYLVNAAGQFRQAPVPAPGAPRKAKVFDLQ